MFRKQKYINTKEEDVSFNKAILHMMDRARLHNEEQWKKLVEIHMGDSISEVEAEERAEKDIQMKDRQRFLHILRQMIEDIMYLRNSCLIRDVLDDISDLMEKSFTTKSAIRAVVSKYKEYFDDLFHDDETESQMSVDEEVYDDVDDDDNDDDDDDVDDDGDDDDDDDDDDGDDDDDIDQEEDHQNDVGPPRIRDL